MTEKMILTPLESLGEQAGVNGNQIKKQYATLINKGVSLLAMREHSTVELTNKLLAKSESRDLVYAVIDELINNKLLSDERFTESYVRSRKNKGFGPIKIRNELHAKGIESSLIDDYLDVNASIWYDNAQQQYNKKSGGQAVADYNTWSKYARFLQGRGFTMEQIQVTLPQVDNLNN